MSCRTSRRLPASHHLIQSCAERCRGAALLFVACSIVSSAACARDDVSLPTASPPVAETPSPNAKRWSDPASWPDGKVPVAGADVVIAKGADLVLDVSPPPLA